ncbi:rhomboid-like protein [Streptantibioticus ferralitis]|uniref:Transmembrane protein n=1 Tax=Streptantibioticus ferralitis TaxID=236510 RepID=A0ABT5Z9M8_9ACTN|nr:rhomboid-like protein [Streptantibioticus ferralitis]MDF2260525.1 hypothetical protein [Streptantibioticus ferralitis]
MATFRAVLRLARDYVRRAPGTFVWLAILLVTTYAVQHFSPEFQTRFLERRSTNIHNLWRTPLRVLLGSALYLDGGSWLLYFVLYNLFHVPAERWLGTWRWLGVAAISHIGATYISEGLLLVGIRFGYVPPSSVNVKDIGVSYALAGVQGVLTYRIPRPWRQLYGFCVLVFYGLALVHGRGFTDIGHFTAVLIGLACLPVARWQQERHAAVHET